MGGMKEFFIRRWHGICAMTNMKKFKPLEIAPWAKAEERRKRKAERRAGFFQHVRVTFALLFFATILVVVHNYRVEVGARTSFHLHLILGHSTPNSVPDSEKNTDSSNQPVAH